MPVKADTLMEDRMLPHASAIEAVADPVARLWCRSFGVVEDEAVGRMRARLADTAIEVVSSGANLDELQERLDVASEQLLRDWFARVLGRPIGGTTQDLAIVRLAFLDANQDGRWGRWFLDDLVAHAELAADMDGHMIIPTPATRPSRMTRQEI